MNTMALWRTPFVAGLVLLLLLGFYDHVASRSVDTDRLSITKDERRLPGIAPALGVTIDCGSACAARCSKTWKAKMCNKMCGICCSKCNCVPPGTSVEARAKCPCYASMTNARGRPKCP